MRKLHVPPICVATVQSAAFSSMPPPSTFSSPVPPPNKDAQSCPSNALWLWNADFWPKRWCNRKTQSTSRGQIYCSPKGSSTGIENPGLNLASHLQRYGFFALLTFKSLHLVCPLCQQSKAADTCHAFCLDGLWFAKCACFLHLLVNVMRQCLDGRQQGRGSRASGRCSLDCDIFLIRFLDLFSSPIMLSLFGGGKGEYVPDLRVPRGYVPHMHHQGFLQ